MKTSTLGLIEIASHEGVCLRPYLDSVGVWTWGVGHTKAAGNPDPADLPRDRDQPIDMVFEVFRRDLARVEADVNRLVRVPLAQHQFDALVSFQFNTGGLGRAQLLTALNAKNYALAAVRFMGWSKPPEIIGRRVKEQTLFRDGTYAAKGKVNIFPVDPRGYPIYRQGKAVDVRPFLEASVPAQPVPVPPASIPAPKPKPPPTAAPAPPTLWARILTALRAVFSFLFSNKGA